MRQLFLILVFFGWTKNPGYGQVAAIRERNVRHLDSIRRMLDTAACKNDAVYPIRYKKKEIRRAIKTLRLFNFFARRNITQDQVDSAISTIKHERMTVSIDTNGSLHTLHLSLLGWDRYISADLKLAFLDGYLIATSIQISPNNFIRCPAYNYKLIDLTICSDVYARVIDYPIRLIDRTSWYGDMVFKRYDIDNIVALSATHSSYRRFAQRLTDGVTDSIDRLFLSQFDPDVEWRYSNIDADESIRGLVDGGQYSVVRDLVFSPNYNVAIEAMEAAIYLSGSGKLMVDKELEARIKALNAGTGRILVGGGCVRTTCHGYKSLNVPYEAILHKFRDSVQRNSVWFSGN